MSQSGIKKVTVHGLHHHLDIELELKPGLNVLYGKNGRGKTTILHIIANVLEADFQRFNHLQFTKISIENFNSNTLEIHKDSDSKLKISLDGNDVGIYEKADSIAPEILPLERQAIRAMFGGRPLYLPAFRAILERVRSDSYADQTRDSTQFELVRNNERVALKEAGLPMSPSRWNGRGDVTSFTARKTIQCREWFGPFVPVIRYPSLMEVSDGLSDELRDAQIDLAQSERKMLSSMFIDVFKALVSSEETPADGEVESLLKRVRQSLDGDENTNTDRYSDSIGSRLGEVVEKVKELGSAEEGAAQRRVLKLYAEMLENRNKDRMEAFHKVKQFEHAVNLFLGDSKTLHVSDRHNLRIGRRPPEPVYVETVNGRQYSLSSLSSGERQVLTMLFSATRMGTLGPGIFLIDEPELSLHVDWQRIILSSLKSQAGDRQILACTHSPEVGADHGDVVQMFSPKVTEPALPQPEMDTEDFMDDLI